MTSAAEAELGVLLSPLSKLSPFDRLLLKWVGRNRPPYYKPTTPLLKALSKTLSSHEKLNLWIYDFTGYAAEKRKLNSAITGTLAYSTRETTLPNIVCKLIVNEIAQYMLEQHISYISQYGYIWISQWTQYVFL